MFNHSGALRVLYYTVLIENLYLICRTLNAIVETIQEETGVGLGGGAWAWADFTCDYCSNIAFEGIKAAGENQSALN